jgi:hypothetical protein
MLVPAARCALNMAGSLVHAFTWIHSEEYISIGERTSFMLEGKQLENIAFI